MIKTEAKNWPDHYRYFDEIDPKGLVITCQRYVVVRESERCYWLAISSYESLALASIAKGVTPKYAKRVLKDSHRRFAYPDKAEALRSYKKRKEWQMRHAQLSMERAQAAIRYFGNSTVKVTDTPERAVAPSEYIQAMGWDYA